LATSAWGWSMDHDVLDRLLDAWNRHDVNALAALMAQDGVFEDVASGRVLRGTQGLQSFVLLHNLSSDYSVRRTSMLRDANRYAIEWELSGTHDGRHEPFGLEPTGKTFSLRGAMFIVVDGEHVEHYRNYYDITGLLRQLGVDLPLAVAGSLETWSAGQS
jgi:steroid delta-isomerase-like uncharacterized protein